MFIYEVWTNLVRLYSKDPPLTGRKPSRRNEEGCCQEGHPSVKVSQSRIMPFNSTLGRPL